MNLFSLNPEPALQTRLDKDGSQALAVQGHECNLGENIPYLTRFSQCRGVGQRSEKWKKKDSFQFIKKKKFPLVLPTTKS